MRTRQILATHSDLLEASASELLAHETLDEAALRALFSRGDDLHVDADWLRLSQLSISAILADLERLGPTQPKCHTPPSPPPRPAS